jgi:hypothetical protein
VSRFDCFSVPAPSYPGCLESGTEKGVELNQSNLLTN